MQSKLPLFLRHNYELQLAYPPSSYFPKGVSRWCFMQSQ